MRNVLLAGLLFAPLVGGAPANATCSAGRDCGTVVSTGFGQHCAWVRVQSSVFDRETTYALPYDDIRFKILGDMAKLGKPITVAPGGNVSCQDLPTGVPSVVYMSNDPAEQ